MKNLIILTILALPLFAVAPNSNADVRAVSCAGCSSGQSAQSAMNVTDDGTVYVFNKTAKLIKKYLVYT